MLIDLLAILELIVCLLVAVYLVAVVKGGWPWIE